MRIYKIVFLFLLALAFLTAHIAFADDTVVDPIFILGVSDNSDAEFAQTGFILDFYPDTQTVAEFPKELNTDWYDSQYLHFELDQDEVETGITFIFNPAWNNSTGIFKLCIEVWNGAGWQDVGRTAMNMIDNGYIDIPGCYLKAGINDMRIRSIGATAETRCVTWDQIICKKTPYKTVWKLGINDHSDAEFSQGPFNPDFNIDTQTVAEFPKEINIWWYPVQNIDFTLTLDECQKPKILTFDVFWSDNSGELVVSLDRFNGTDWESIGVTLINSTQSGEITIPVYKLNLGVNQWRLHVLAGLDNTHVVVWDSIALYERKDLPIPVKEVMEDVLDVSLNHFLSTQTISISGLPLTAHKVTDRQRYGYSNLTEWGYALQAWIAASERGIIKKRDAARRIRKALRTMRRLQRDPDQFTSYGMFYPFYKLIDNYGNELTLPAHDTDTNLPSCDNALLYASINIAEGWARLNGFLRVARLARIVKRKIDIRACYQEISEDEAYICHQIDAETGELSSTTWNIYANEAGMIAFVAYLAGSVTLEEYGRLVSSMERDPASWNGHSVLEAAFFNPMFIWTQRSIAGYPMFGGNRERMFGAYSLVPNFMSHLDYGDFVGVDYPAFSDAMTQTHEGSALVGNFVPPNILDIVMTEPPDHSMPHALFSPCCGIAAFDKASINTLYEKWTLMRCDISGVWHPSYSQDPYGFEVVASPYLNQSGYSGADEGRYIFETLSAAYTAFPIYDGLKSYSDKNTYFHYAMQVKGYGKKVVETIGQAYPDIDEPANLKLTDLSVASQQAYEVVYGSFTAGAQCYIDSDVVVDVVPSELEGATLIKTADADKQECENNFLYFDTNKSVEVLIAYAARKRILPRWLRSWRRTGMVIKTTNGRFRIYSKHFPAGTVILGSNCAPGTPKWRCRKKGRRKRRCRKRCKNAPNYIVVVK